MKVLDKHALGMIHADYQGCTRMNCNGCHDDERCSFWDAVENLKEIDAELVRHAYWEKENLSEWRDMSRYFKCSNCGKLAQMGYYTEKCKYDYCPNCGAKMDGGKEDAKQQAETDNDSETS